MGPMGMNYILLVLFLVILMREIYRVKKQNRLRLGSMIIAIIAILLMLFAIIKGIPISQLQTEIEGMLSK